MTQTATVAESSRTRSLARDAGLVVALAGLTTVAAKVAIPLPGTPVPATLQVAAVIFAGSAFGPVRGGLSQLLYLLIGLAGVPVFAASAQAGPAVVAIPTFGYLAAFPLAAWLAGRWTGSKDRWLSAAFGLGTIYLLGVSWLWVWAFVSGQGSSLAWALMAGLVPFVLFDLAKAALAAWTAPTVRKHF